MNTGFADAYTLSGLIVESIESPKQVFSLFEYYTYIRQRAFKKASGRSASGMRMGTRRGKVLFYLRKLLIVKILFSPNIKKKLASHFSMLDTDITRKLK